MDAGRGQFLELILCQNERDLNVKRRQEWSRDKKRGRTVLGFKFVSRMQREGEIMRVLACWSASVRQLSHLSRRAECGRVETAEKTHRLLS